LDTADKITEYFRTMVRTLTGKADLVFGDPLSDEDLQILDKIKELRARGIPI
jgi:hypothetical protein